MTLIVDFITINMAWIFFYFIRVETGWFSVIIEPAFLLPMLVVFFYWFLIFTFAGMYRTWFAHSRIDELITLFKATFVGIFILFMLIFIDDYQPGVEEQSRRYLIFIYWGLLYGLTAAGRLTVRSIQRGLIIHGFGRRNAIIIGFSEKARAVAAEINSHRGLGLDVVAFAADKEEDLGKKFDGIEVVGHQRELGEIIDDFMIQEVVIAVDSRDTDILINVIATSQNRDLGLKIVPDLYSTLIGAARTSQLYGFPLIDINPQLMTEWEKALKRVLDISVATILLILTSPVMLATSIAIKLNSPGPVFYLQERCGLNGKAFKVIKFRSMRQDAEKQSGPVWSSKGDPRITRVGRFIRKVRIDELPQMMNVLKGEMSLVGPRPERPYFVEKLSEEIPYYKRRLKVRPGITGWAQVKHKYDESVEDVKTKLQYDLFYIENISIMMDFKILFRTVFVVLFGKGHY